MSLFDLFGKGNMIDEYIPELKQAALDVGIEIRVTEVKRSAKRQTQLWAQGRTTPGQIVTWTRRSRHQTGRAVDVTIIGAPEYEDDPEAWELLGLVGEDLGLRWGGSYRDYGHFEV